MQLPILDKHNNISIASFLEWYSIEEEKGNSDEVLNEILLHLEELDTNVLKIIILALLSRGKKERDWVYEVLFDFFWDDAFMDKIKEVFEKYHERGSSFLIIDKFPTSYIKEHMDELPDCFYIMLCDRLIRDHVDVYPDWKRLLETMKFEPSYFLDYMDWCDIIINDSVAYDILYSAVYLYATSDMSDDIGEYIKEKGKPIVPSDLDYFSKLIDMLISSGWDQVINKYYEWEKELYLTIKYSDTFIKLNEKEDFNKSEIELITKKCYYMMLPDKYKSPTDSILDWFVDDSSYVKRMEEINPNLTLLIDKLGLNTTDH